VGKLISIDKDDVKQYEHQLGLTLELSYDKALEHEATSQFEPSFVPREPKYLHKKVPTSLKQLPRGYGEFHDKEYRQSWQ